MIRKGFINSESKKSVETKYKVGLKHNQNEDFSSDSESGSDEQKSFEDYALQVHFVRAAVLPSET